MPGKKTIPNGTPKPKCLTCGKTVRTHKNRWCSPACVPKSSRQFGGKRSGQVRKNRWRWRRFEREFQRLTADGNRLTKGAILEAFESVADTYYNNGYHACKKRFQRGAA